MLDRRTLLAGGVTAAAAIATTAVPAFAALPHAGNNAFTRSELTKTAERYLRHYGPYDFHILCNEVNNRPSDVSDDKIRMDMMIQKGRQWDELFTYQPFSINADQPLAAMKDNLRVSIDKFMPGLSG